MQSIRCPTGPSVHTDLVRYLILTIALAGVAAVLLARAGILLQAVAIAGLIALLVRYGLGRRVAETRLGPADRITLLRAAGVAVLAGLPFQVELSSGALWFVVAGAGLLLLLDGIDGAVARHTGTASAFGARFDMELDAFFILVLCLLIWQAGPIGAWVLLIGLLRYLFVGGGLLLPALREPLAESRRRKLACVVQVLALLMALAPLTTTGQAEFVLLTALALLVFSFAVDTLWLLRNASRRHS